MGRKRPAAFKIMPVGKDDRTWLRRRNKLSPPPRRRIRKRRCPPPSRRLRRSTARAPSCAWAKIPISWWRRFPPGRCRWISRWASAACPRGASLRFTAPSPPARPRSPCILWPRHKSGGARWPTSTPSTPWTPPTPGPWGWISTPCSSPNRTPANRVWRSARPWCAPGPLTWWWWIPLPP